MKVLLETMGSIEEKESFFSLLKKQRQQKVVTEMRASTMATANIRKETSSVLFLFLIFILVLFII